VEKIEQVRTLPDPKLTYAYYFLEVETRVGPQRQSFSLAQTFPWFGKLQLRGDAAALGRVYEAYFQLADALASDNLGKALAAVRSGRAALKQVDAAGLSADAAKAWNGHAAALGKHLSAAGKAKAINDLRTEFHLISQRMRLVMARFGQTKWPAVHLIKCPMAFDSAGATWLQLDKAVKNPYFGAAMLRCGEIVETIQPVKMDPHEGHRGPASGPARQGGR